MRGWIERTQRCDKHVSTQFIEKHTQQPVKMISEILLGKGACRNRKFSSSVY